MADENLPAPPEQKAEEPARSEAEKPEAKEPQEKLEKKDGNTLKGIVSNAIPLAVIGLIVAVLNATKPLPDKFQTPVFFTCSCVAVITLVVYVFIYITSTAATASQNRKKRQRDEEQLQNQHKRNEEQLQNQHRRDEELKEAEHEATMAKRRAETRRAEMKEKKLIPQPEVLSPPTQKTEAIVPDTRLLDKSDDQRVDTTKYETSHPEEQQQRLKVQRHD